VLIQLVMRLALSTLPGESEGELGSSAALARADALSAMNDDAALAWYREAERLKPTAQSARSLARGYERLGDAALATLYDRLALAREPDSSEAPSAAQRVGTVLGKVGAEGLGLLEVMAPGASRLRMAGREFPSPPAALFLQPGEYEVVGTFPSGAKTTRLRVKAGQVVSLIFEPVRPPLLSADQALSAASLSSGLSNGEAPPPKVMRILSIVAMGAGVLAGGAGIALGASSAFDASRAQDTTIPRSERQLFADSANAKAVPANVLMIGGALVALGGGLLFYFSLPEPGVRSRDASAAPSF
jgi:hypothetical protein